MFYNIATPVAELEWNEDMTDAINWLSFILRIEYYNENSTRRIRCFSGWWDMTILFAVVKEVVDLFEDETTTRWVSYVAQFRTLLDNTYS